MENEYCSLSTIPLTAPPISSQGNLDRWFAVVIRSSQARVASMALQGLGYEQFQPMRAVRRQWSDRVKVIQKPLFPGYVFCRFTDTSRRQAPNLAAPVSDAEISRIRTIQDSGLPAQPWPYKQTGQKARVERGSLAGLEGVLIREKDSLRVVVSVERLRRSVAVEIERDLIRAVQGAAHAPEARVYLTK